MVEEEREMGFEKGDRKSGGRREKRGERELSKKIKVVFWNISGLANKDEEFWKTVERWYIIFLSETWVENKDWDKIKNKLPMNFTWRMQGGKGIIKRGEVQGDVVRSKKWDRRGKAEEEEHRSGGLHSKKGKKRGGIYLNRRDV